MSFCASALLAALVEFRRRAFHHRKDRPFPVERLAELIVALAPIQIGEISVLMSVLIAKCRAV